MMSVSGPSSIINSINPIPKWQLALAVGAPVALGLGYIYYRNSSKPSLKPGRGQSKDLVKENGTKTDKQKQVSIEGDVSSSISELCEVSSYFSVLLNLNHFSFNHV